MTYMIDLNRITAEQYYCDIWRENKSIFIRLEIGLRFGVMVLSTYKKEDGWISNWIQIKIRT
jgi:hypothetical protein